MHLQRKLEVNKLPDVEIKIITKNGILTDLTIGKEKNSHPNTVFKLPHLEKTNVQGTKKDSQSTGYFMVKSRNMEK